MIFGVVSKQRRESLGFEHEARVNFGVSRDVAEGVFGAGEVGRGLLRRGFHCWSIRQMNSTI